MYEKSNYKSEAHAKVAKLREEIKAIHKDLEEKGLANIPSCHICNGEGSYFTRVEQDTIECPWCKGECVDYLITTHDVRRAQ